MTRLFQSFKLTSTMAPTMNGEFSNAVGPDWVTSEASTGTTIVAVEFDGGVVIGADSRASTGAYVSNRVTDKLTRITDHIYCCRSGSSADTQAISDIVNYHLEFHEVELGEAPEVKAAATVFQNLCYNYRDQLVAGIICAGWDRRNGGQVYSIPLGGMCVRMPFATGGSGSTYVFGFVDSHFKKGMNKEECVEFVSKTLALAMNRDGSSGGVIRLGIITEKGMERRLLTGADLPQFYED